MSDESGFPLPLRVVDDLPHDRGIDLSLKTARFRRDRVSLIKMQKFFNVMGPIATVRFTGNRPGEASASKVVIRFQ